MLCRGDSVCLWGGGCGVCHSSCQGVVRKVRIQMKAKEKYRGMFEIQKSGEKTSSASGEIGLDHRFQKFCVCGVKRTFNIVWPCQLIVLFEL